MLLARQYEHRSRSPPRALEVAFSHRSAVPAVNDRSNETHINKTVEQNRRQTRDNSRNFRVLFVEIFSVTVAMTHKVHLLEIFIEAELSGSTKYPTISHVK